MLWGLTVNKLNRVISFEERKMKVHYFSYQDAVDDTAIAEHN